MSRIFLPIAAAFALLTTLFAVVPSASADQDAPIALAGCTANTLEAGDDAVAMTPLGFIANTGDASGVDTIYVSENGIVSFDGPIDFWYHGFDLRDVASWFGDMELVAPLYADAVRDDGGSVTYGQATYQGRSAFCVEWNDLTPWVPEFITPPDPLPTNSFQLILVERNDRAAGDFDVIVNYDTIGWDDTYCEEDFAERAEAAFAAPGGFNGCGCDFEGENGCQVGFAEAQLAQVEEPVFESDSVGALAGLAFPQGFSGQTIEFPGSGEIGEMVDASGLAAKSLNSLQPGRFVVEIRNGFQNANLGTMQGSVSGPFGALAESLVSACTLVEFQPGVIEQVCVTTRTDDAGLYEFGGAPEGQYTVRAFAPPGSGLITETQVYILDTIFGVQTIPAFDLEGPQPPADNVTLLPIRTGGDSTTVYWNDDLDLSVTGCAGGTASWIVTAEEGPSPLTGNLTEGPDGTYSGVIPALFPTHGRASISITIDCPGGGGSEETSFSLYIDPAGVVVDLISGDPVPGAEVLLERRGQGEIEFTVVPDGSEIMSETNRANPTITGGDGLFSWFTIPGEYRVTASAAECTAIALPPEWADRVLTDVDEYDDAPVASASPILQVPPEWLELVLTLDCPFISNNAPTIEDPGPLDIEAPAGKADLTAPGVDDLDPTDNLDDGTLTITNDAPDQFVLGVPTDVTWTVADDLGASASVVQTVTAVDTTAPMLNLPDLDPVSSDTDGAAVIFEVTATDAVDVDVTVECAPESGEVFPIGTTEVACTATDDSGNEGTGAFDVVVNALCNDLVVTIDMNTNGGNGIGTADDDVILGTPGDDMIEGLAGNDTICAGDGNDTAVGGDGDDTILGQAGDDILRGNAGVDTISGGDGNDRILGGIGNDTMNGDEGDDYLGGFGGADIIDGGPGNETIFGGFGADTINGGDGNDTVFGLIGNDIINGGAGNDQLNGNRGNDTINGGAGDDVIDGGQANDTVNGDGGDDSVSGGKADDALSGGDGDNDICVGNQRIIADTADATCETIFGVP